MRPISGKWRHARWREGARRDFSTGGPVCAARVAGGFPFASTNSRPADKARMEGGGFVWDLPMNVLVVDVGGTHVKILATGQKEPCKLASGPTLTARQMVSE